MDDCLSILQSVWGYSDFRGIQREIIDSIMRGCDTLGLMPTGGGKSITFQVPALAQPGLCLVITPLISLMKDQVDMLRQRGIKASAIYSGMHRSEVIRVLENCILGDYKFLYVSPERLFSELFLNKLQRMEVCFITVDEAHCISQWGYDFRPSYLQISSIRKQLPHAPVLALTATATPMVVKDIQNKLEFKEENVFRMSFYRENLHYSVCHTENKSLELIRIFQETNGSAIVYVRSRKETKDLASWLTKHGISALHYHAGLYQADKDLRQQCWKDDEVRVMVATNAFGMGIDKPDVRLVVHMDLPDSPEAYYQEAGRAGRDGKPAKAILLYNGRDKQKLTKRISDSFPEKDYIRTVYVHLAYYYQIAMGDGFQVTRAFDLGDFCRTYKYFPVPVLSALKILTRAGYIEYIEEQESYSKVFFLIDRDELYRLQQESPEVEMVLDVLLRNYGGLFSEYVVIHEKDISVQTGIPQERIYEILKGLTRQGILHYIPHKRTPYIRYTQRRIDENRLYFSPEVYEKRKEQYEMRVKAMIDYATQKEECRSTRLLRFFGEHSAVSCGSCDVCLSQSARTTDYFDRKSMRAYIFQLLGDGLFHNPTELVTTRYDKDTYKAELSLLVREEEIIVRNGLLGLK